MFLPPPLKSSAAMRAASTEPMPLVSWKMPEMSLSTPTRTTLSEICARAAPQAAHDKRQRQITAKTLHNFSPLHSFILDGATTDRRAGRVRQAGRIVTGRLSSPRSVLL